MGFKETKIQDDIININSLEDLITFIEARRDVVVEETELTWAEHAKAVEAAQTAAEEALEDDIDAEGLSNIEKLGAVIEGNLNDLINERISIEDGPELLALTQAVFLYEANKDNV